ncbi:MAG: hypothetical protein H7A42_08230 [Chlamydiales bacterium]|nr:hypothetical protein [Chlamydiales bacterium]
MRKALFLMCLSFIPCFSLFGLNGMYRIGYGTPSKGIGGVAAGFPQDTFRYLANPAQNLLPVKQTCPDLNLGPLKRSTCWKIR